MNNSNNKSSNNMPKEIENLLASDEGKKVVNAIKNMDNASLSKLLDMAKNVDQKTIDNAIKNPDLLKKNLQVGELMAQLNKFLKG